MSQSADRAVGAAGGNWWYSLARAGHHATIRASTNHKRNHGKETALFTVLGLIIALRSQELPARNATLVHP